MIRFNNIFKIPFTMEPPWSLVFGIWNLDLKPKENLYAHR